MAAHAASFSWDTTNISATRVEGKASPYVAPPQEGCTNQTFYVGNNLTKDSGCVYQADGFEYAFVARSVPTWWGGSSTDRLFTIRFPGEQKMYRVQNISAYPYDYTYIPHSKHLVSSGYINGSPWGKIAYIIKNLPSKLTKGVGTDLAPEYILNQGASEYLVQDENSNYVSTKSLGVSPNGRWLAAEVMGRGLVKINLSDFTLHWYSIYRPSYGYGSDGNIEFAVTNDGRRIAAAGVNISPQVAEINDLCGLQGSKFLQSWYVGIADMRPCPEQQLSGYLYDVLGDYVNSARYPSFDYEGGELQMYAEPYYRSNREYRPDWIALRPSGYQPPQLQYLALGDSYSSGEGDIGKGKDGTSYYLPRTDGGVDNCHISSRSYPFLIRDKSGIPSGRMQSVACSGAQVIFDYNRDLMGYMGQGGRLSQRNDIASLQSGALDLFTPGYVPQLEFVKKYKPGAITLTGGGNDVGFADIISYCASPTWEELIVDATCGYAVPNSELRKMLGRAIYDQYFYTIKLINMIKQVSPNTIINIVGYPSFIAGSASARALNSGFLDGEERDMINEGVVYMNRVLAQASIETGVHFIDIENSLVGGRLCEGSTYVTGVSDIGFSQDKSSLAQTFHPNADGHQKIASTIVSSGELALTGVASPLTTSSLTPPAVPVYFGGSDINGISARRNDMMAADQIQSGDYVTLNLPSETLQPDSTITVAMYSSPMQIGKYTTSGDGAVKIRFKLPGVAHVGRHVITVTGSSYSGEPMQLFKFIEVTSTSPDDKDGDGIKNDQDKCQYIAHYYDETTGEDVCARRSSTGVESTLVVTNDSAVLASKFPTSTDDMPKASTNERLASVNGVSVARQETKGLSLKTLLPIIVTMTVSGGLIARRIYEQNKK